MRARRRAIAAAAVFTASLLYAGIGFAQISVTSGLLEIYTVPPGTIATKLIRIGNLTDQTQTAILSLREPDYISPTATRSATPLLDVPTSITLAPRETRQVPITIQPPANATGTYVGRLLVEPGSPSPTNAQPSRNRDDTTLQVRQVIQYAVELIVDVPGPERPSVTFRNPSVQRDGDTTAFRFQAFNPTNRWSPQVAYRAEVFDTTTGELLATGTQTRGRLHPGAHHEVTMELGNVPEGNHQLLVVADLGMDDIFAIRYTLAVTSSSNDDAP